MGEFKDLLRDQGVPSHSAFIAFSMADKDHDGKFSYCEFVSLASAVQTPVAKASPKKRRSSLVAISFIARLSKRVEGEDLCLNDLSFVLAQPAGSHLGGFFRSECGGKFYVKFPGLDSIHKDDG